MRQTGIFSLLLLAAVSFGIAGGCNNNGNGNNNGEVPEAEDTFDLELAIDLGELALVAYEQRIQCINSGTGAITVPAPYTLEEVIFEPVSTLFNSTCLNDTNVIPIAFIATEGENIYVVFRGTANVSDAISDFAAIQVPYLFVPDGGLVAFGFLDVYGIDSSEPIVSTILNKLDELTMTGNFSNLYITGHSLGAALAFLAFPDFSLNVTIDNITMYNFAGPAVGDSTFVSAYEGFFSAERTSVRIVNTNDLVPMLPPQGLDCTLFSYEHVDGEHEITFGTPLPALPDFTADDCDLVAIAGQLLTYGITNSDDILEDHSMCTYFDTLCSMGSDPSTCAQRAIGCNDGNQNP